MAKILPINQSKYEIELKKFIDHLAEIKIDFKLNLIEKEMIEETGSATILYSVCLQKCLLENLEDTKTKTLPGIRQSFFKYMLTILNEDFITFANLLKNYFESLESHLTKKTPPELYKLLVRFVLKGFDYLQEKYDINELPFNNEMFFDGISLNESDFIEEDLETLLDDFEKSQKKVKNVMKKHNKSKTTWINSTAMAFNHKDKNFLVMMDTPQKLLEEYELMSDMIGYLTTKYLDKEELYINILKFIKSKDLEDELNECCFSRVDEDDDDEETQIIPF